MHDFTLGAIHFLTTGFLLGIGITLGKILERRSAYLDQLKKDFERWDKMINDFPYRFTFRCDICHELRIDAKVSIKMYKDEQGISHVSIRYFNDNTPGLS